MSEQHVLVVDDEPGVRETLGVTLRKNGYEVSLASTAAEALERLSEANIGVVISDVRMPGMGGEGLLDRVIASYPDVTVIIMSAYGSEGDAIDFIKKGAYDYISKPIMRMGDVVLALRKAEERERLKAASGEVEDGTRSLEADRARLEGDREALEAERKSFAGERDAVETRAKEAEEARAAAEAGEEKLREKAKALDEDEAGSLGRAEITTRSSQRI